MPEELNRRLDLARRDLLDLGLRNTLLNHQPLRSRGAEVTGASPAEVFRLLVTEGRSLPLKPAEPPPPAPPPRSGRGELAAQVSAEPAAQEVLPAEDGKDEEASDNSGREGAPSPAPRGKAGEGALRTPYTPEQLQPRLLNTWYTARTFLEEQGVNILYVALGMLEWTEAETAETRRKAPLILVPVEISRSDVRSQFRIRHTGEEVGDNLSLRMKLEQDFGLRLPELPEEEIAVEDYFGAVREAVASQTSWRVDESAVVLGFFSFSKLLMYRDLDPRVWFGESAIEDRPSLLRPLLDGVFQEPPPPLGDDENLDRRLSPQALHPVVDADSWSSSTCCRGAAWSSRVLQGRASRRRSPT